MPRSSVMIASEEIRKARGALISLARDTVTWMPLAGCPDRSRTVPVITAPRHSGRRISTC
jgi:hypothetical protein